MRSFWRAKPAPSRSSSPSVRRSHENVRAVSAADDSLFRGPHDLALSAALHETSKDPPGFRKRLSGAPWRFSPRTLMTIAPAQDQETGGRAGRRGPVSAGAGPMAFPLRHYGPGGSSRLLRPSQRGHILADGRKMRRVTPGGGDFAAGGVVELGGAAEEDHPQQGHAIARRKPRRLSLLMVGRAAPPPLEVAAAGVQQYGSNIEAGWKI